MDSITLIFLCANLMLHRHKKTMMLIFASSFFYIYLAILSLLNQHRLVILHHLLQHES